MTTKQFKDFQFEGTFEELKFPFPSGYFGGDVEIVYRGHITAADTGERSNEYLLSHISPVLTAIWHAAQYDFLMAGTGIDDMVENMDAVFDLMGDLTDITRGIERDDND